MGNFAEYLDRIRLCHRVLISPCAQHSCQVLSEFLTRYPRRISFVKGLVDLIRHEEIELDHLSLMVKSRKDEIIKTLLAEGFRRVKFENKKSTQIGSGFAKRLMRPWEMHVRLLDMAATWADCDSSRGRNIQTIHTAYSIGQGPRYI